MATTIDAENAKQIRKSMDVLIQVTPETGEPIVINNDNLISCVVSLRSDLSILNPTLPESEINIEAYFDEDISEALAAIPDETPITYQAGYEGDMSPVRKFYLAEQITWANNVMSIHAVDAVHLLDVEMPASLSLSSLGNVYNIILGLLSIGGVAVTYRTFIAREVPTVINNADHIVVTKRTLREAVAGLMWLFTFDIESTASEYYIESFRPAFVDAGIPNLTYIPKSSRFSIYESDCGDVQRQTDRKIGSVTLSSKSAAFDNRYTFVPVGTYDWYKNTGAFLNIDDLTVNFSVEVPDEYTTTSSSSGYIEVMPNMDSGVVYQYAPTFYFHPLKPNGSITRMSAGSILFDGDIKKGLAHNYGGDEWYTQFIPWDCPYDQSTFGFLNISSQLQAWNKVVAGGGIPTDATSASFDLIGQKVNTDIVEKTYNAGGSGEKIDLLIDWLLGDLTVKDTNDVTQNVFPDSAVQSILDKSPITGSFHWKGDPRMQPRDVFTFHRLDGTDEVCTLENITITHEGGGTSAEITYRKGIC